MALAVDVDLDWIAAWLACVRCNNLIERSAGRYLPASGHILRAINRPLE